MKKLVATLPAPGRLTVLAALLGGLAAPALAADVVISQVYGGGSNNNASYLNDYVEIFNRSGGPVDITGWSVQYGSAAGTGNWSKVNLPAVQIQPGQYLLVRHAAGSSGTAAMLPLPATDAGTGANMSATAGKVALVSNTTLLSGAVMPGGSVVDMIGFGGTANSFEGNRALGASGATVNSDAMTRKNAGCTDTDDNLADFTIAPANPRNSASARNTCGPVGPVNQPIVPECPTTLSVARFSAGSIALNASDVDNIVNDATITGGARAGITLGSVTAGASASVNLQADATLYPGIYPITVTFSNDATQKASCTVNVSVEGTGTIPQLQGSGATSPFTNSVQTTEGVVTHLVANGYFIQDQNGDGDLGTSDGVFVYTGSAPTATVGDLVRVKGLLVEFLTAGAALTFTEIKDVMSTEVLAQGLSIAPTNITLDTDMESVEAMLVNVTQALTVNQTDYLGERGELSLAVGRREIPTNLYRPGTPEAIAMAAANAKNSLTLDDGLFSTPTIVPYIGADGTVRAGDTVTGLTGAIEYGSVGTGGGGYKLQPTVAPQFSRTNPRIAAPVIAPGNVRVASANVLNFFTDFTDGTNAAGLPSPGCTVGSDTKPSECRGADNLAEFVRQRDKIVKSLVAIDADVIGLMEIQNNGDVAAEYLANALNAVVGVGTYAHVPTPQGVPTGTDAIRVTMLYKPAKVSLVGPAMLDGNSVNNRPPMAQTFRAVNGGRFSLIVNHFKSKASCGGSGPGNTNIGDGQACWNLTRINQANRLANVFIPQVTAAANDTDVLVIGDLNAYAKEDPIYALNQAGLLDQIERFVRPSGIPYSYVFGAESGYLDHALASASLAPQVADVTEWHNNADEPEIIDYNIDEKLPNALSLFQDNAFRASDHDPVVISLALAPTFSDVSAGVAVQRSGLALNRLTGKYTGTITLTNTSGAALTGPIHVRFNNLSAGVTLDNPSGKLDGVPYLTVNAASLAPGAKVTLNTVFTNPSKVAINYGTTIFSGNF